LNPFFEQYLLHHELPVLEYFFENSSNNETFLNFKWDAISSDFNMPVLAKVNNKNYSWIYPSSTWNKIELIDIKNKDFKIATELLLLETRRVK